VEPTSVAMMNCISSVGFLRVAILIHIQSQVIMDKVF